MLVKEISLLFSENIHGSEYDHIHPALGGWLCWKIKGPWRPRDDFLMLPNYEGFQPFILIRCLIWCRAVDCCSNR